MAGTFEGFKCQCRKVFRPFHTCHHFFPLSGFYYRRRHRIFLLGDSTDSAQPLITGLFFAFYILSTAWVIMVCFGCLASFVTPLFSSFLASLCSSHLHLDALHWSHQYGHVRRVFGSEAEPIS
jgi:hypothetical protein